MSKCMICNPVMISINTFLSAKDIQLSGVINNK